MKEEYLEYIKENSILNENLNIDFSDQLFAYDYNEVQELLFEPNALNFVYLVGEANLRKNDMLARVCQDLYDRGINKSDILYLNLELPIFERFNFRSFISKWAKTKKSHRVYLIINEIQLIPQWDEFVSYLKTNCLNVQLVCSSTTPKMIHERLYDLNSKTDRVVVLSKKNDSNIKYESQGFGVYNNELKYNIKNNIIEIKGMTKEGKKMAHHVVPTQIEGYPVKVIASGAFHDRPEMLSIEIPDCVEMIGDYAFTKCINLKQIKLPKSLKYIGENSFLGAKGLEKIIGGDDVSHIGNSAFYKTKWLEDNMCNDFVVLGKTLYQYNGKSEIVEVGSEIETIGNYAFKDTLVKKVKLNGQRLLEGCFYNCSELEEIESNNLNIVPAFSFFNCKKLKKINCTISEANKFSFYNCISLKSINVKELIAHQAAFQNCKSLEVVNEINIAMNGAFANTKLKSVTPSIKAIGKFSFYKSNIESVNLSKLQILEDYCFSESNIKQFKITSNIELGKKILFDCNKVETMDIPGNHKVSYYFGNVPNSITNLYVHGDICDDFNRNNTSLRNLYLYDVNRFGRWSFYNNVLLENVELNNVTNIGEWAFAYCDSLLKITLPEELKFIGLNGFRYCHNLNDININARNVVLFGNNAFYSTGDSKKIYIYNDLISKYNESRIWNEYSNCFVGK